MGKSAAQALLLGVIVFLAACSQSAQSPLPNDSGRAITGASSRGAAASQINLHPINPVLLPEPVNVVRAGTGHIIPMTSQGDPVTIVKKTPPIPASALTQFPAPRKPNVSQTLPPIPPKPTPTPRCKPCGCNNMAPTNQRHGPIPDCPLAKAKPYSIVYGDDQGGQSGYSIAPGSQSGLGDVYVAQVIDSNISLNNPTPGDPQQDDLFSPTTHGPNGNCLEVVTDYSNGYTWTGTTHNQIMFYDFCANGGQGAYVGAIPSSNFGNYVTTYSNGNGLPEYVAETTLEPDNSYHLLIANWVNNTWDDYYASAPGARATYNNGQGWSMMETHYPGGTCSNVPGTTGVSGLRLHYSNTPHQNWQLANGGNTSQFGYGYCFMPDDTQTPWYRLYFIPTDWGWQSVDEDYSVG